MTMINSFDPAAATGIAPTRPRPDRAARTAARPGLPAVLRQPGASGARRGRLALRPGRHAPISTSTTTSPSVGHCHPHVVEALCAPGGDAQHPHALSARRASSTTPSALLATVPGRARPCDVHLHRQRGQRPRRPHRQARHRRHRRHRHADSPITASPIAVAGMSPSLGAGVALGAARAHRAGADAVMPRRRCRRAFARDVAARDRRHAGARHHARRR